VIGISRVTNARRGLFSWYSRERTESISIPEYKGFCNAPAAVWNAKAAVDAVHLAIRRLWPITSISVAVWHGDSITAVTTLLSGLRGRLFCARIGRSGHSIRRGSSKGEGHSRRVQCPRINRKAKWNLLKKYDKTKAYNRSSITAACYLCNTHPKTA
jgi:hypothetical protein